MANTLTITSLAENIFRAKDRVAAEPTGFIQSVLLNSGTDGVSINGTVTSFRTALPTLNTSYTPAMTVPDGDDQTIAADTLQIDQVANVRIPLKGETLRQLDNTAGGQAVIDDLIAQAIRKMRNTIEAHVGTVIKNGSSRATGTAGTNPFATNINPLADVRQILIDNGTPDDGDLSLVINTSAGTKMRQIANLYKVNEAGSPGLLRNGELTNLMGLSIKESAGVASHTKGTGSGYLINNGSVAVGSTTLTLDTGSGTILAGDILTHASDSTNKYVVSTALASNDVVIARPGLLIATANNDAVTVGNSYTGNVAFHKSAVELVMRPPAQPYGGDAAVDRMTIADDKTGLVFEAALYKGYGMNMLELTCFYKAKVWKPEFVATLLG
jgi:hypothetical protein